MSKPSPKILTVWRIRLTIIAIIPALALTPRHQAMTPARAVFAASFTIVYLAFFLFYLPSLYKSLSYQIDENTLVFTCGVICKKMAAMPLCSVQTVSVTSLPLCRAFGLLSLRAAAANSRLKLPGLHKKEAEALAERLKTGH